MEDLSLIQNVIDEYFKSESQSEAEVSSKFIAPLAKALGYPTELMALEFPIYGFGGREKLPAKDADFVFFTDKEFGKIINVLLEDESCAECFPYDVLNELKVEFGI